MRYMRYASCQRRWWIRGVLGLAITFALGTRLTLKAQDGYSPAPDGMTSHLFLPAVSGGAGDPTASDVIPGQYIVVLQDPAVRVANGNAETAAAFASRTVEALGGEVLYSYDTVLSGFAAILPADAVSSLATDPNVAYVEPDREVTADGTQTGATWGLDRIDQSSRSLNGNYVYNATGAGVHAYIVDTGIRATHLEFSGRIGTGATFISDGQGTNDCNGHGTHVAGTVGGTTYGVAKQVTLHAVRVLGCTGSGTTAGVIAGINWVAQNKVLPAVANMSLGGSASPSLDTAVANAVAQGIVFAVAAGNEDANACNSSPAREPSALTVGSTTNTDIRSSFSNYGTCLDLFAPGSNITSAAIGSDTGYTTMSGTSMAAPHAAGAAALYLSVNLDHTPAQVVSALLNNATINNVTSPGTGSPNRLLYTLFIGNGGSATATPTLVPTATPVPGTPTPTSTPTAMPTHTPTAVPTTTPAPGTCPNLQANPGFEQGRTTWNESSARGYTLICTKTSCGNAITPRTGAYESWLGGGNGETAELRQTVALPAGLPAHLVFSYQIGSADYCRYDYAYLRVLVNGVTTTLKTYSLCASTKTTAWVDNRLDISKYAGKTVTLIFRVKTDASMPSSFFVDDTGIFNSSTCAATRAAGETEIETVVETLGEDLASSAESKPDGLAGPEESAR